MVFVENPVRRMIIQDCPCHSGGVLLKWNRIDPDFSGNIETAGICADGKKIENNRMHALRAFYCHE